MTAITKTTKRAESIIDGAHDMRRYSLDEYFRGAPIDDSKASAILRYNLGVYRRAKLTHNTATGRYSLTCHGNLWYEFSSEAN